MWMVDHFNAGERFQAVWVDLRTAREQAEPVQALRIDELSCRHSRLLNALADEIVT